MAAPKKMTTKAVKQSNGDPMKISDIAKAAEKSQKAIAKNELASQMQILEDEIVVNDTTFYKPTALHKWYLGLIGEKTFDSMVGSIAVVGLILSTPAKQLKKTIFPKINSSTFIADAVEQMAKITDDLEVIGEVIEKLIPDSGYMDYGDDNVEKK
ncbi:hypothetical protein AAEX28_04180 [Lentisphaerota bacterium WC36G]|nr:hypothetical protein LJT99_07050 [Lentisphaerae bacterium WC36]